MTTPPPPTPVQTFNAILNRLIQAVDGPRMWGTLDRAFADLIKRRFMMLRQQLWRLTDRIEAGTYKPRRPATTPRKQPADRKPRQPSPLRRQSGWLLTLLPDEMTYRIHVRHCRNDLRQLLQDPEMLALMAAAPGPMRRTLRPFCWMLALKPPPVLARPRRPRRPKVPSTQSAKPKARRPKAPQPPHEQTAASAPSPLAGEGRGEGSPRTRDPPHPA